MTHEMCDNYLYLQSFSIDVDITDYFYTKVCRSLIYAIIIHNHA